MANILILGKSGMLGSMLDYYFSSQSNHEVFTTSREPTNGNNLFFDAAESNFETLSEFVQKNKIEYILNAIGIIKPYCKDGDVEGTKRAILVNSFFPYKLASVGKKTGAKIIQIVTDCVFSGKEGSYVESSPHDPLDVYGKTKSLGEVGDGSMLNIRCSIIGPERKGKLSLLEWFLNQPAGAELKGFTHHKWNGITTLRFAKLMDKIISDNIYDSMIKISSVHHFVPNYTLTKYDMLVSFNKIFDKGFKILEVNNIGPVTDRSLATKFENLKHFSDINFEEDLIEMKKTMDENFYKSSNGNDTNGQ